MQFKKFVLIALFMVPATGFSGGWDLRVGVSQFPDQDALLSAELTRVIDLALGMELGLGGVLRTNFASDYGLGAIARFRYWFIENIALGGVGEVGYMIRSDDTDFGYTFLGPLLVVRLGPLCAQWEPGWIFYHSANFANANRNSSDFVPLRFVFGLSF